MRETKGNRGAWNEGKRKYKKGSWARSRSSNTGEERGGGSSKAELFLRT